MEYKLNVNKIPSQAIRIYVAFDNKPSKDLYTLVYNKERMYSDIQAAEKKLGVLRELGSHFYVHLATAVLNEHDILEHILSSIVTCLLNNGIKNQSKITVTHDGDQKIPVVGDILALLEKVQFARKVSMLPANIATPEGMAMYLKKQFTCKTRVYKHTFLYKHHFNLIRAVGESAKNPPSMLVVERIVKPDYPTIAIVGKGITFDTGGLALKTNSSIMYMKYDKLGAIHGAMALAHLVETEKEVNFVGVFPFAENAVSENSVRPGDVIKSHSGKTVEITDPDAEGRLILADALSYIHKYKPDLIIDIATLTGHAEMINCWHSGYYFAIPNRNKYLFETVTEQIGERMIPMPTWTDYSDILKSSVADLVNLPMQGCSDSFVAALFLREFLPKDVEWVHIDLAHEYNKTTALPKGNGMRSIVAFVREWLKKK